MKRTKTIHTTVGDLIVSLTDETLKTMREGRPAYRIVASMFEALAIREDESTEARAASQRRSSLSTVSLILFCACLMGALSLTGCMSTFEPGITGSALEAPRLPTARETRGGVEVAIEEYFSSHKSRRAFDADVGASGVLPILVHVENRSTQEYRLERKEIRAHLSGQPLQILYGLQAAEAGALRNPAWNALVNTAASGPLAMFFGLGIIAGSASQTQRINRQIEHHFERMELADRIIKPNETATGFVFFKMPPGAKSLDDLNLEMTLAAEPFEGYPVRPLVYQFAMPTP